ncbi:hypothetical protein RM550_13855 [Streptomyces sp. DSM 41527]|uniref:Molecular chaperone DnaJ n=1 Tax=Streptomyces mooreae TaxID=3075523 RepID=A0ABU2T6F8_9ACTN|nr:hypothetical protein [Streptomyces sp. DSM 41527]MDT0456807.1 hypothetical protein [Streptomyces sp. DSM 41527]
MPENTARTRLCRDCDGFPAVAITTGQRTPDGSRRTITVTCRACDGTGMVVRRPAVAREVAA